MMEVFGEWWCKKMHTRDHARTRYLYTHKDGRFVHQVTCRKCGRIHIIAYSNFIGETMRLK